MMKSIIALAVLVATLGIANSQPNQLCIHTLLVTPVHNFDVEKILGQWYGIEFYSGLTADATPLPFKCLAVEFSRNASAPEELIATENYVDIESGATTVDNDRIVLNPANADGAIWSVHSTNQDGNIAMADAVWLQTDYENWALQFGCDVIDNYRYESLAIWSREPMIAESTLEVLRVLATGYGYPQSNIRPIDQMC